MKKKIVIANWKMNPPTLKEAEKLFGSVVKLTSETKNTEIVICAPFIYLSKLKKLARRISLGAQDVFWEERGPFTGEISPVMLSNIGVKYVILGHSERRGRGETNADINKKLKLALYAGLHPILCVGEEVRDQNHGYFNLVKAELEECLAGIPRNLISKVVVAYEPIWAISSTIPRRDATPEDCREMIVFIRKVISDKLGPKAALPRLIYGGSVNDKDAEGFLIAGGADGVLPGKASLDPKKFAEIIKICEALSK